MEDKFVKITNTVYKMLEFFPESEPLKNRAKEKALSIMENLILLEKRKSGEGEWVSLKEYLQGTQEKPPNDLSEDIEILLSFLKLGKFQGWISDANFLIICNEYEKIKKEIEIDPHPSYNKSPVIEILKKINTSNKEESQRMEAELPPIKVEESKPPLLINKPTEDKEKKQKNQNIFSERQNEILKFLKKNKKAQVMDLKKVLNDVTKRTIRRDIDDLLKKGSIVRVGEWNQVFYQISENN